jgi:hypothetical protein
MKWRKTENEEKSEHVNEEICRRDREPISRYHFTHTHSHNYKHTHTHTYIYIYIKREREIRKKINRSYFT